MSTNEAFIQELDQEAQTTRRVLERVPDDQLGWKPHDKSMSLGQLALHVAGVPGMVADIASQAEIEVPDFNQPEASSGAEVLSALDASLAKAKTALQGWDESAMGAVWTAKAGGRVVMEVPRAAVVRSIMFNHWYHHRGQLSVDLRLLNVPVPSIYGPSADENPFS